MDTKENNRIMAEFMNFKSTNKCIRSETGKYYDYHSHPKFSCIKEQEIQIESENGFGLVEQDFLFIEDLKFHSDWNWLMEVVIKINQLEYNRYSVRINQIDCKIYDLNNDKLIVDSYGRFNQKELIKAVYYSCAYFVKWYNEQKK